MTLQRRYFTCRRCGRHSHPLDERLGVEGFVSPHAQRLLCLLGAEHSFEQSARLLREVAGLCVCDNTVRTICDEHGGKMRTWQREAREATQAFREAEGEVEFQTDGTCVNTWGGWREIRLSIFAKRRRGRPVEDLDAWDSQRLPEPTVRIATAAIRTAAALGPQWRRSAARLGLKRTAELTVLADGAKWIWNEAKRNFPGASLILDVYHASEHLHAAALAGCGEGAAATQWFRTQRRTLLESGASGLLNALDPGTKGASELAEYLRPHVDHTPYRQRLAEGRSIGSGMVEGACKTAIGKRLKQTGSRWRVRRLERMAALCCLVYSDLFEEYWKQSAA